MLAIVLIGGGVVLILVVVGIIISISSERTLVDERLGKYLEEDVKQQQSTSGDSSTPLSEWVNRQVEHSSMGDRISRDLARADLKFKVGEYFALIVIATFGLGGIAFFIGGQNIISFLIGAAVGMAVPPWYVSQQQGRRLQRFNDQLPDMINLMVNGLRAGYSTLQAMEAVSRELPAPICDEFRRVVQEMQLGITMEKSLENLLRRIPSEDLDFVVTAVNVQREVGGPLAEILDTISFTIRERIRIKGEIRVMTAQVLYSGRLLALIPFFIVIILWFINQEYMMEFVNSPVCGGMAAGLGVVMIGIGYFIMTKIANIEV